MTVPFPSPRDHAPGPASPNSDPGTDLVHEALEMPLGVDADLGVVGVSLTAAHETLQRRLADLSR